MGTIIKPNIRTFMGPDSVRGEIMTGYHVFSLVRSSLFSEIP
jgi:hypothetical protein